MREIIFRGKAVIEIDQVCEFWEREVLENGNWIQGDLIWNNGIPFIVHGVIEANDEYISLEWWMPVDPETVGQFTGIKDKNGKMIFDGDICSYYTPEYHDGKHFYKAERETGEVRINTRGVVFGGWQYTTPFGGCVSVIEVIGNIHDNPELIT